MTETKDIKSFYTRILHDSGIDGEFTEVSITAPTLQGDNFCSICDCVTVHRKNGAPIKMFVKRRIDNPDYSKIMTDLKVFEKEAGFFNEIIPEFHRIIKSRTGTMEYDLELAPKCYFANKETIVMENLMTRGFILLDKTKMQDYNHAQIVVKNLAKFHAPSYIILTEEKNTNEMLSQYPCLEDNFFMERSEQMLKEWLLPCFDTLKELLKKYPTDGSETGIEILEELSQDIATKMQTYVRISDDDLCHVINHGDCWNNNMMFLEDPETKQLVRHIFMDFQMIRLGSPNLDIGYYFYTSLQPEVRRSEWKNLLKIYYDSLVEQIATLKGNVRFSFEDFVKDYKRKFVPGFVDSLAMGRLMEASKDLGNLEEVKGDVTEHIVAITRKWLENNPVAAKQIAQDLTRLFQEYTEMLSL